jgi:glyoxylase-like metal-dependent hydrolase (beta-lactamase superfamily II)
MERARSLAAMLGFALALGFAAGGCTMALQEIRAPSTANAGTTGGPWTSMIYAARTDEGVVVVDLGWEGSGRELQRVLDGIGAEPAEVVAVFITHSHRDHIAGWPAVRHARFHMGEAEIPYFVGEKSHQGAMPRLASIIPPNLPDPGELEIEGFSEETVFAFGADTVRAFPVPGHTPGSAAYLVRGVLFAGDALSHTRPFGFQPARRIFSHDHDEARESLHALLERVADLEVEYVCTAHAICTDLHSLTEDLGLRDPSERRAEEPALASPSGGGGP